MSKGPNTQPAKSSITAPLVCSVCEETTDADYGSGMCDACADCASAFFGEE